MRQAGVVRCYILEYKCNGAAPGRHIVTATNGHEALGLFLNDWARKYEAGEVDIATDELQDISIQEWCDLEDVINRF